KFDFIGLCYSAPESIVYKYRLDDIHRDWRETPDRYVSYPYLPPGKYTFKVKAVNNDGVESEAPVEVTFTIQPPYWKTWWFILLEIMTALSIFLLFFLWRIKRTKDKLNMEAKDRQLVMAQRMELMGTLAAGAVHDLKNLLAVISGYAKIVGKGYDPGHRNYKHVEKIKKTTSTAVQVVKQILAFAKQNHNKSNAVDIVELLSDIVEILVVTQPSEVRFIWQPPAETISLPIHPTRFQQLVMNLCINAVHAMPDGGELRIALSTEAPPRNREGVKSPSPGPVLLEISDTGSGMEKDVLDKIFDPLYTTKDREKGTGLGLFVVKQVVREYDGNIEVKSQPGKGTTFCIRF
ncbi:MAG: hypothetical protein GY765_38055, partial [bacterium]|nr:hypothetical protein [bacterium]